MITTYAKTTILSKRAMLSRGCISRRNSRSIRIIRRVIIDSSLWNYLSIVSDFIAACTNVEVADRFAAAVADAAFTTATERVSAPQHPQARASFAAAAAALTAEAAAEVAAHGNICCNASLLKTKPSGSFQ